MGRPRLHVVETIGKGGFGIVMRAWMQGEHGFLKEVAVKLLTPEASKNPQLLDRLRDEARLLALVNHRSVVRADGLTMHAGRWAVVMELVQGVSLARLIRQGGALTPRVAVEILAEVASALAAMHGARQPSGEPLEILHRDVKPGNVKVTATGDVKLLDFGNARAEYRQREARTEQLTYGTLAYMAPERFAGTEVPPGDVYSLGTMAFELLTARRFGPPAEDPDEHATRRHKRMTWLQERLGPQGHAIVSLLEAMLALDPAARPTAAEIERSLLQISGTLPGPSLRLWAMDHIPGLLLSTRVPWVPPSTDEEHGPSTSWVPMMPPAPQARTVPPPVWPAPSEGVAHPGARTEVAQGPAGAVPPSVPKVPTPPPPPSGPAPVLVVDSVTGPAPRRAGNLGWLGAMGAAAGMAALVPFLILAATGVVAAGDSFARRLETPPAPRVAGPGVVLEAVDWPEVEARPVDGGIDPDALVLAEVTTEPILARAPEPERPETPPVLAVREPPAGGSIAPARSAPAQQPEPQDVASPTASVAPAATTRLTSTPPSPAIRRARVVLRGDAEQAVLVDSAGSRFPLPGAVPPGAYSVLATFPEHSPASAGTVRVTGASTLELECLSRFALCRPS